MTRVLTLVLGLIFFAAGNLSTAFAADDCEFCKKDHKKVCADECPKKEGKPDGCMKNCFKSKCATTCADKKPKDKSAKEKKAGDKAEKPAKKDVPAKAKEPKKAK